MAVELAIRFRGEVINADAMQLYHGLPIITNKITSTEQRGITHHLLGHITLDELPWDVEDYKREDTKVMREIRARGNLPILVGGTQYYVDPLLFKDVILDEVQADPSQSFPLLQEPTEVLLKELQKVDPAMAERWHPNDRRKIQRSLEIYLTTGKPASEFYAEQQDRKAAMAQDAEAAGPWEKLLFWVHSDREVLCERLDTRVDKMIDAGLLDEVQELFHFKRQKTDAGQVMDMTKGIWQSIGYKQFEPHVAAIASAKEPAEIARTKAAALEEMKVATRRYANYQTKWIRLKQIPRIKDQGPNTLNNLYLLDSTDVAEYQANVVDPAARITAQFLGGEPRPMPTEISDRAREVLSVAGEPPPKGTPCKRTCEACQTVLVTEELWQRHLKSAGHRRVLRRKKRLALVPVDGAVAEGEAGKSDGDRASSPEIGSMFSIV